MSLPKGRNLFAERMDLMLIEELQNLQGLNKLSDPDRARHLQAFYGEFVDVSPKTKAEMISAKSLKDRAVALFWNELRDGIKLTPVDARLAFGKPESVEKAADCFFEAGFYAKKRVDLQVLRSMAPAIEGSQPGFFDDICFFDIPINMIVDGAVDLTSVERFLTAGTTVSFFLPAPHHMAWYTYAKRHSFPLKIKCTKKLSPIFDKAVTANVHSIVLGVGRQPSRSDGPETSSTNSTTAGRPSVTEALGVSTTAEGRPISGSKSEST